MKIDIYYATPDDLEVLADIAQRHLVETPVPIKDFDRKLFIKNMTAAVCQDGDLQILVAYQGPNCCGYAFCYLCPYLYTAASKKACMEFMFILPEYRATNAATLLVKRYVAWARENKAAEAFAGVEYSGDTAELIMKFFERQGFTRSAGLCKIKL